MPVVFRSENSRDDPRGRVLCSDNNQHSAECSPPAWDMLSRREFSEGFPQLTWSQWHPEKLQDICKVTCGNLETMCVTSAFVT